VTGDPPLTLIVFSEESEAAQNAIERPSGENTGLSTPPPPAVAALDR
jgi:hypothetical protein